MPRLLFCILRDTPCHLIVGCIWHALPTTDCFMASSESGDAQVDDGASGDSSDRHSPVVLWMDVTDGCTTQDDANTATCRAPAHAAQVEMNDFAATQCDGSAAAAQMTPLPVDINHVACQLALARAQLVKAASTRAFQNKQMHFFVSVHLLPVCCAAAFNLTKTMSQVNMQLVAEINALRMVRLTISITTSNSCTFRYSAHACCHLSRVCSNCTLPLHPSRWRSVFTATRAHCCVAPRGCCRSAHWCCLLLP
jgi:hypothetical protein